jgi:hypothetical protein
MVPAAKQFIQLDDAKRCRLIQTIGATDMSPPTSKFCTSRTAVIQARLGDVTHQIEIGGRHASSIPAWTILPKREGTIACPLIYFQEQASLPNQWIRKDDGQKEKLDNIKELNAFTLTIFDTVGERECPLPERLKNRLLRYFIADIAQNRDRYVGFDCYAFMSFLTDTAFQPESPPFTFEERDPRPGEVVVFAAGPDLPNSIKHWALSVGEGLFLSKFGQTVKEAQALIEVTDTEAPLRLYDCDCVLVATRQANAPRWNPRLWEL